RERFTEIVGKLRRVEPEIGVTTDIIVGFPSETDEDFEQTLTLVREIEFDNAFVFKYSRRRDTPAAQMPGQLEPQLIEERHARFVALVNDIARRKFRRFVGQQVQVLVEGPSRRNSARLEGRTACNKIVVFEGAERHRGQLLEMRIVSAGSFTLYGDP